MTAHRLVGHGHYADHIVAALDQTPQALHSKLGRTHIDNP